VSRETDGVTLLTEYNPHGAFITRYAPCTAETRVSAMVYCALISINYFVQLTLVAPHMARGEIESIRFLLFTPFDSFLYSVDLLGYGFMSVATLLGAFALTGGDDLPGAALQGQVVDGNDASNVFARAQASRRHAAMLHADAGYFAIHSSVCWPADC
jgi:hypothetical protein